MKFFDAAFGMLQQFGKAIMLPVAVLPAAGILLAVGFNDFAFIPSIVSQLMESAGGAIFGNLPILFAVGIALGMSKNDGVAAFAACIFYAVMLASLGIAAAAQGHATTDIMGIASIDSGVFGGIIAGGITAFLFNKYHRISLPVWLGFFGGKRFVPIVASFWAIIIGCLLSVVWPPIGDQIQNFSDWASKENPMMAFGIYGFVERLLIPFGLHHIWNAPFFYEAGTFVNPDTGEVIKGELQRYMVGDSTAGNLAGGFLFKMWGLPAAAIAIWHTARPENRAKVGGLMIAAAVTSFVTGITEPIELAFLLVAPVLYFIHAILASAAFMLCIELGIKHSTTFSHGLFDFIFLYGQSTKGWMLFIIGPIWAALYYIVFRAAIVGFNLKTPGRDLEITETVTHTNDGGMAQDLVLAFGGRSNITSLDACITRLRISVNNMGQVNQERLKALGATAVITVGNNAQAIFGTSSENLKTDMETYLASAGDEAELSGNHQPASTSAINTQPDIVIDDTTRQNAQALVNALGGQGNIKQLDAFAKTRLRVELKDSKKLDQAALTAAGVNAVMELAGNTWHLIIGNNAEAFDKVIKS
ncbi:PTS glucose transporter subunit IIBC [Marinagarivorans algicola]|uniref:PTS glucose transporter subunit IIBC n=1 Tax=Marinagarivorans algicola TaxID=1513270 RepID=UPI0006B5A363|nr:PTS glucose transporter subunit IIBC [Marinagarivorans algicola]